MTLAVGMIGVLAQPHARPAWPASRVIGSMGTLLARRRPVHRRRRGGGALLPRRTARWPAPPCSCSPTSSAERRGGAGGPAGPGAAVRPADLLAGLFFLAAIAMAGLPPLSGFIGKLLILETAPRHPAWPWIWARRSWSPALWP